MVVPMINITIILKNVCALLKNENIIGTYKRASCKIPIARCIFCDARRKWRERAAISGMMRFLLQHHKVRCMNTTRRDLLMQRWYVIQQELLPELRNAVGTADAEAGESHPHPLVGAHGGVCLFVVVRGRTAAA